MLGNLDRWVKGSLVLEVKGTAVERFMNLAVQEGILLSDAVWLSGTRVYVTAPLAEIFRLRQLARQGNCRFRIRRRSGLPFVVKRMKKRKTWFLSALLFLISVFLMSNMVFSIEVTGPKALERTNSWEVKDIVAEKGLQVGRFRWQVDFREVEKYLILKDSDISWVGIERKGTKMIINIVERDVLTSDEEIMPLGYIVAQHDGIIEEILVIRGKALVKSGDKVVRGQVLITGELPDMQVSAAGMIKAHVYYEGYGECALTEEGFANTGNSEERLFISWGGEKKISLNGGNSSPFADYTAEEEVLPLYLWRGVPLPVSLVSCVYREKTPLKITWTKEEAFNNALSRAKVEAMAWIPTGAEILGYETKSLTNPENPNIEKAQVICDALFDMGLFIAY